MFEKQDTASFNLTNEVLKDINVHIRSIFCFMKEQALIDEVNKYFNDDCTYSNTLLIEHYYWILDAYDISVNGWDCFCEFVINFFTHFIALWDGILFNGRLKIEKSAQLRKFVNFLRETQINQAPSNLTSKDFGVDSVGNVKFSRYDQTSMFQAFSHLRISLPEIPQQENNLPNNLLD